MKKKPQKWSKKAKKEDIRKAFDDELLPLVENCEIENRAELIYQIQDWGYELNRTGKNYISVVEENGTTHRLTGAIYGKGFDNGISGIEAEVRERKEGTIDGTERTLEAVGEQLDKIVRQQARSNRERYQKRDKTEQRTALRNEKKARKDNQNDEQAVGKDTRKKEPISEDQRRIDDDIGTESIGRVREFGESTARRAKAAKGRIDSSANRTENSSDRIGNYLITVGDDQDALEQGTRQRGRRQHERKSRHWFDWSCRYGREFSFKYGK